MKISEAIIDPNATAPEGEATIILRRAFNPEDLFKKENQPYYEAQWVGPIDAPVTATLTMFAKEHHQSHDEILAILPWPLKVGGPHPTVPQAVYLYRTDI